MATNANPFVVNIVDLQNIATGIGGTSKDSQLTQAQADIANIQQMVDYTTRTISADVIQSFTPGSVIDVMAGLNLSNASLYSNSNLVSLNTSNALTTLTPSTIGGSSSSVAVSNSLNTITFKTAGLQAFLMDSTGNAHFSGNVSVGGNLTATTVITSSDRDLKTNITPLSTCITDIMKLEPQKFQWKATGTADIGFIAQDVQAVWPELVEVSPTGSIGIVYTRFVPLLLEGIRELNDRVNALEAIRDLNDRVNALEAHLRNSTSTVINGPSSGNEYLDEEPFRYT